VARREDLLKEVGDEFSKRYVVEHRVVVLDVSREDFIRQLASVYSALARHFTIQTSLGVYVTELAAGVTNTAVPEKFALDPRTMPMKPMLGKGLASKSAPANARAEA
jgi:hypothetical protein